MRAVARHLLDAGAIGKYYPVHMGIVGDATAFATCLADSVGESETRAIAWRARNEDLTKKWNALWEERGREDRHASSPLKP